MKIKKTDADKLSSQQLDITIEITKMSEKINYIQADVTEIKGKLEGEYVNKLEFDPIKRIVYGMVGLILTGVVGALIALVLTKQ
jgi:hypothetical protein